MTARRIAYFVAGMLCWAARWALVALMLVVVCGVCLRMLRLSSVGIVDTVCLLGLVVFAFSLAHTQVEKRHMQVDILVSRLGQRAQTVIDAITYLFSVAICCAMFWYSVLFAYKFWHSKWVMALHYPVPMWCLASAIALCILLLGLVLVIDLYDRLVKAPGKR